VFNFEQIGPEEFADYSGAIRPGGEGIMAVQQISKCDEYRFYAEHCLELVRIATSRKSRIIQRQMAAEWFKLADMFSASEQPAE
jgi:hypothetical protein